jgi:hypothetical protein
MTEPRDPISTLREALEYNLHWLEADYGVVEQDHEAKTNRRLSQSALASLEQVERWREALTDIANHSKENGARAYARAALEPFGTTDNPPSNPDEATA